MFTWLIALLLVALFLKMYIFEIYEVRTELSKDSLYAGNEEEITLTVVPLNAFGFRAPFRSVPASIEVTGGNELISLEKTENADGKFTFKAGWKSGPVEFKVTSKYSLFPMVVTFIIKVPLA